MASVCEELLQLLGCDVVLVGVMHANAKAQRFLSLIGRCSGRAEGRAVDLNAVLSNWNGGGHPAAAAASVKLRTGEVLPRSGSTAGAQWAAANAASGRGDAAQEMAEEDEAELALEEAYWVMQQAVQMLVKHVPSQACAADLMTSTDHIVCCSPQQTMAEVLDLMNEKKKRAVPVCDEAGTLLGFVKYNDPIKAAQQGKSKQQVKAWMRREYLTVAASTPFADMEQQLLEGSTGRLHVVDEDNRLLGLVSRTDLLREYDHYKALSRRGTQSGASAS